MIGYGQLFLYSLVFLIYQVSTLLIQKMLSASQIGAVNGATKDAMDAVKLMLGIALLPAFDIKEIRLNHPSIRGS
jgi:hypothetical protein